MPAPRHRKHPHGREFQGTQQLVCHAGGAAGCGSVDLAASPSAEWQADHDVTPTRGNTLTRLHLTVARDEPDRWCRGLWQVSTLRALRLSVFRVDAIPVVEFSCALSGLEALEDLHFEAAAAVGVNQPAVRGLLTGIGAGAPRLRRLSLSRIFKCKAQAHDVQSYGVSAVDAAFSELANLTRLSRLSIGENAMNDHTAAVLAHALKGVASLREVCARRACRGANFVARLCGPDGLTGLRVLDLGCSGAIPTEVLTPCVLPENGAGLAQVTALNLERDMIGAHRRQMRDVVDMLRGMPLLASLCLQGNPLRDKGLGKLARALPDLTALTHLDVSGNKGTFDGVFAVVQSARKLRMGQAGGLMRLGIAGAALAEMCADRSRDLSVPLAWLKGLQEVDLRGLPLRAAVLQPILRVLCELGRLRVVQVAAGTATESARSAAIGLARVRALERLEVGGTRGVVQVMREAVAAASSGSEARVQVVGLPEWLREDKGGYSELPVHGNGSEDEMNSEPEFAEEDMLCSSGDGEDDDVQEDEAVGSGSDSSGTSLVSSADDCG